MKKTLFLLLFAAFSVVSNAQLLPNLRHNRTIKAEKEKGFDIVPFEGEFPKKRRSIAPGAQSATNWGVNLLLPPALKARVAAECQYTVVVKVYDTGYSNHAELSGQIPPTNYTSDPTTDDQNGHGTHTAGIVGAKSFGIAAALGDKLKIKAVKVLDANGSGQFAQIRAAIIEEDKDNRERIARGEFVINNFSLGGGTVTVGGLEETIQASPPEVIYFGAAGNNGSEGVIYPARSSRFMAIAAIGENQKRAYFSNTGPEVFLGLPGVAINSTYLNGEYAEFDGTSMAAPFGSGLAAIALSKWGQKLASLAKMKPYLERIAADILPKGFDKETGYGAVFIETILDTDPDAQPPVVNPPTGTTTVRVPVNTRRTFRYFNSGNSLAQTATVSGIEYSLKYKAGEFRASHDQLTKATETFFTGRSFTIPANADETALLNSVVQFVNGMAGPLSAEVQTLTLTIQNRTLKWQR
jgi:hypothetical protein